MMKLRDFQNSSRPHSILGRVPGSRLTLAPPRAASRWHRRPSIAGEALSNLGFSKLLSWPRPATEVWCYQVGPGGSQLPQTSTT